MNLRAAGLPSATRGLWRSVEVVRELDVVGVRVEMPSNQPIVLLREVGGERYLPIWIGAVEATAIAFAQQGVTPERPMTHDLFKDVLEAIGATLEQVRITEMRDSTYYAELVFAGGIRVSSPPVRLHRPRAAHRNAGSSPPSRCSTRWGSSSPTAPTGSRRTRSRSSASSSTR